MNFLIKIWKDPVWSKLISTALVFAFTWVSGLFPVITEYFFKFIGLLKTDISIPVWALVVVIPLLLLAIPVWLRVRTNVKHTSKPDFLRYTEDNILGINWSWGYNEPNMYNDKYTITTPMPRCPSCNSQLEINDYSAPIVRCINNECTWKWQQKGHFNNWISHSGELNKKIHNVIDRKIHNREY